MSIRSIKLTNFRNIEHLEYAAKSINVLYGPRNSGKTTILDAIAFANSSDHEFYALLKASHGPSHEHLALSELIKLNFFAHKQNLESFSVRLKCNAVRSRLFEIWKTDPDMIEPGYDVELKQSPYILVFDSPNLSRMIARSIPYSKLDRSYKVMRMSTDYWPDNYIGIRNVYSADYLNKKFLDLCQDTTFKQTLKQFVEANQDVARFQVNISRNKSTLSVLMRDRETSIPLLGCPESVLRMVRILISLYETEKDCILIDQLEYQFTEKEIAWLIPKLCSVAYSKGKQLFISTQKRSVVQVFEKASQELRTSFSTLLTEQVGQSVSETEA